MAVQTRLFVGNLPGQTNEQDLRAAFSEYGEIVNLDLKTKTAEDDKRNFAFITFSTSHNNVESCLNHFDKYNFNGQKLYVTRARESFLERLQRERQQEQAKKEPKMDKNLPIQQPVMNLCENLNPVKRQVDFQKREEPLKKITKLKLKGKNAENLKIKQEVQPDDGVYKNRPNKDHKKEDSDKKRMESMKKKRQDYKIKQTIIKTGLFGIDQVRNNKIIFTDDETSPKTIQSNDDIIKQAKHERKFKDDSKIKSFLDMDDSGDEISFDIKKQFEGKNGQKVLELQSRYKSDKRFILDERFIDNEQKEEDEAQSIKNNEDCVELGLEDEKSKQLDILQDVLGVALKRPAQNPDINKKTKSKLGMPRFDPSQPGHAKFLAPVEQKEERTKKTKMKKQEVEPEPLTKQPKPVVSKEQFYNVSETLKEAIAQPTTFSLRSLFGNNEESKKDEMEQDTDFIPLEKPKNQNKKAKNPLEPGERNPFVYDSSDSEVEEKDETKQDPAPGTTEVKAVWKENLFFSLSDHRLQEGLEFFNKSTETKMHKERRELKSLMKKRIYNKERKNQMFQKKIGGRKNTMKSYRMKT